MADEDQATPQDQAAKEAGGAARLDVRHVSKSFGGIHALTDVSLRIHSSEVHALLGENGAGKSTLVKIITGVTAPDSGEIWVDGQRVAFASPVEARAAGVSAMYQDPKLFPDMDIAENIFIGIEPLTRLGSIDRTRMYREAAKLLASLEADLDPTTATSSLSIAQIQFVEFARAMAAGVSRLLILDEPTASLTPPETDRLFRAVRALRARGVSIIIISHRLEELESIVDRVTILRDGRHIATGPASKITHDRIVQLMVGRSIDQLYPPTANRGARTAGRTRLSVEGLSLTGVFDDIAFHVDAGEIVAMAGLVGAGRTEIARSIYGLLAATQGRVVVEGAEIASPSPRRMLESGVFLLPEDRDGEGLITVDSIQRNIVLPVLGRISLYGLLNFAGERELAQRYMMQLEIKAASPKQAVASLSGGNRQKVVFGKSLAIEPKVLILDEPTHGIDIGTKSQIHRVIRDLADQGLAILLISSDLPEVLRLGDRIIVIADGRLVAEFDSAEATEEKVIRAAIGHRDSAVMA
jgi:rhamnose transport system ATP-binding protein